MMMMIEEKTIRAQRDVSPLPSEPDVTDQAAMFNNLASAPWRCLNLVPNPLSSFFSHTVIGLP